MHLNFTINIDDRIVKFLKKSLTRRNVLTGVIVLAISSSIYLQAGDLIPGNLNEFTSGSTISSSEVNANFNTLRHAINAKLRVEDAAGNNMGTLISMTNYYYSYDARYHDKELYILSPGGYIYRIYWNGKFRSPTNGIKYTSTTTCNNVGSEVYYNVYSDELVDISMAPNLAFVFYDTTGATLYGIYTPFLTGGNFTWVPDLSYSSTKPDAPSCNNVPSGSTTDNHIQLQSIDAATLGITFPVVGPVRVVSDNIGSQ